MNTIQGNKLISVFLNDKISILENSLNETALNYRPFDPGLYLYKMILKKPIEQQFTDDFIELVYTTLVAWNMDSRGAKLSDFKVFRDSLLKNKDLIIRLSNKKIENLTDSEFNENISIIGRLFENLKLVAVDKPLLVTFSKTIHFYMPNLFMPIDRKYTLTFFFNHYSVDKSVDKQFAKYSYIQKQLFDFIKAIDLIKHIDNNWNMNLPKIVDNAIIGYIKNKNYGAQQQNTRVSVLR